MSVPDSGDRIAVAHIVAPAVVGGLERVVQALAIGQHRRGHRVLVIVSATPGDDNAAFLQPLRDAGIDVELVTVGTRNYLAERALVRALLSRECPDIVHTHGYRPDLLHAGVARAAGVPIVSTLHGSSRLGGMTRVYEWVQERALRRFDAVIAVSRPLGDRLAALGIARHRLHVVPNGWSSFGDPLPRQAARDELGLSADARVIGWVGRLIPAKGCDLFLQSLSHLKDQDYHAVVIGDGPSRARLEQQARAQGLDQRVSFVGSRADASRYFRAFDVYVLSSRTEGTPIVLFEAMAADVPIVATRVGGVADVLANGSACLTEPGRPEDLADGIAVTLTAHTAAAARAAVAHRRLEGSFGVEAWLDRHDRIYRNVIMAGTARHCSGAHAARATQ